MNMAMTDKPSMDYDISEEKNVTYPIYKYVHVKKIHLPITIGAYSVSSIKKKASFFSRLQGAHTRSYKSNGYERAGLRVTVALAFTFIDSYLFTFRIQSGSSLVE